MLTNVEVYNSRITTAPFPTVGSEATDPIQIHSIEGLGPVNADVNTSEYGAMDGDFFVSSRAIKRNIVMTVGLNPNWATQTVEGLRQVMNNYFMPKSKLRLRFYSTHMPTVEITGYVESFEQNLFSQDPEYQVSIICPSPSFVAASPTVVTGNVGTIGGAFNDTVAATINYLGNVETGILLYVQKGGASADYLGALQVINASPYSEYFIANSVPIDSTQYVSLSTVQGNKYLRKSFVTPGPPQSSLSQVAPSSVWMQLKPGTNKFMVLDASGGGHTWTMTYYARYGGL